MLTLQRFLRYLMISFMCTLSSIVMADQSINIPIFCYHNLNPVKPGTMNMTPQKFESQIKWLIDNGYHIIPLKEAVEYLQDKRATLPSKSVVITADDGWKSVYTYMAPIIKKYKIPVTLFIYPQTISKGKNAMTWDQLKELYQTGLFDIQSHTYDHPNFKIAKRNMSETKYANYVRNQLVNSKKILEDKLQLKIDYLAWPFGIYNDYLQKAAADAGYSMAFSIDARSANRSFKPTAQPRYMIIDKLSDKTVQAIAKTATAT